MNNCPKFAGQRGEALVEINFRILGHTAVRVADRFEVEWTQPKPRGMFSVLLLSAGRLVPVDELIDWMWPDGTAPGDPAGTLGTYRKRIVAGLNRMANPPRIIARDRAYRLDVDREEIDFHEFRRMVGQARADARQGDHASAVRILTAAVDLVWVDTPILDLHGEHAVNWRQMAETEHFLPAHNALLSSMAALGEHDEVLRRIADLPSAAQSRLTIVKHRLAALHAVHRFDDALTYFLSQHRRMMSEANQDEGDALRKFHDELLVRSRDSQPVVTPSPAWAHVAEIPHLLPHDVSGFTGREDLLRHLDSVVFDQDGRPKATVAVLSGQPGVGKTAVALRWAHSVADRFAGGQLYHDLNGFGDGPPVGQTEIVTELLTALGFPADAMVSAAGRMAKLRSLLSGDRALVVLDNVRDSEHVRSLVACLSNCTVIVTSRCRLRNLVRGGAVSILVPALSYPEAKSWLSKWLGPRVDAEPTAAGDLVALCGGIALALRIAAEHMESRPGVALADFVNELSHELLGLGGHGASVRVALDWSYHALKPDEQRMFRLLGVNPGPDISLAAASALAGKDSAEVKRILDVLVDAHLLNQPESRDRFRFHDAIRLYAMELAATTVERSAAEERLVCFYLFSAQNVDRMVIGQRPPVELPGIVEGVVPVDFPTEDAAMRWTVRERANINSVLKYSAERGLHVYVSKLPSVFGEMFQRLGYRADVVAGMTLAVASVRAIGGDNKVDEASWLGNLAFLQIVQRDFDRAMENILSARMLFEQVDYPLGRPMVDYYMGRLLLARGDIPRAIAALLNAWTGFQRVSDAKGPESVVMSWLAEAYRKSGNLDAAASFCQDSLWNAERMGDAATKARVLSELAVVHLERGKYLEARGYCVRALKAGHLELALLAKTYQTLASVHFGQKEYQDAERCARHALTYSRGAQLSLDQAAALRMIAESLFHQARADEAAECLSLAMSLLDSVGERSAAEEVRRRLAEVAVVPPVIAQERTEPMRPRPITGFAR
jgi:tetratricopeptide (TPR) repeat protein/DNA-binding SARP family transcriptional activator/DNA polymerase III delta prime subunit